MELGWKPDVPDHRDYQLVVRRIWRKPPHDVDMRKAFPAPYDQGNLGSCVANAVGAVLHFDQLKQKELSFIPSRLFIYYGARVLENTLQSDSGCEIRDAIKVVHKQGGPPESLWPYDESKFAVNPSQVAYQAGLKHQTLEYSRVGRSLVALRQCLADGFPVVVGISVYDRFMSDIVARSGIVNLPTKDEGLVGGHAVLVVGYTSSRWIVRNSWGAGWGMAGYFTMPNDYLLNADLSDDFWTIRRVE